MAKMNIETFYRRYMSSIHKPPIWNSKFEPMRHLLSCIAANRLCNEINKTTPLKAWVEPENGEADIVINGNGYIEVQSFLGQYNDVFIYWRKIRDFKRWGSKRAILAFMEEDTGKTYYIRVSDIIKGIDQNLWETKLGPRGDQDWYWSINKKTLVTDLNKVVNYFNLPF